MADLVQKWVAEEPNPTDNEMSIREHFWVHVNDEEMEWLQNALAVFLPYLSDLREKDEAAGILQVEVSGGQMMTVNDVLIDSYVQVRQLRAELVKFAGRDMTING